MGRASEEQAQEALQAFREKITDPDLAPGDFTDEDWITATERVRAIREKVLSNPKIAELEARKYEEIRRQVHTLQGRPAGAGPVPPFCPDR